jgi:WD40 repeat protein
MLVRGCCSICRVDMMCIVSQPGFTRIATGEMGVRPKIMLWDVTSMECTHTTRCVQSCLLPTLPPHACMLLVCVLTPCPCGCVRAVVCSGFFRRAVTHLAFSPDGTKLAAVGADASHSVAVYSITKTCTTSCSTRH